VIAAPALALMGCTALPPLLSKVIVYSLCFPSLLQAVSTESDKTSINAIAQNVKIDFLFMILSPCLILMIYSKSPKIAT
jgi:hypothetical protein